MSRPVSRALLVALAWVPAACGGGDVQNASDPRARVAPPDVLMIVIDTLRADALSFYGNERETAPFLANLADAGTVFARAYATSTWTAPATASLVTGVYPDRHGVIRGFLAHFREAEDENAADEPHLETLELLSISSDTPTLAERFRELGYDTYGLASNVNIGAEMAFDRGFDLFERHDKKPANVLREKLLAWKPRMLASDQPRFVYLHFNDVHSPYTLRKRFYVEGEGREKAEELRARYESELGFLDSLLQKMVQELAFGDRTIVVLVADHGEEFAEHGGFDHGFTLFNELNQVPFMIHAPGLGVRPGVVEDRVGAIDLVPTVLDLAGFEAPDDLDGRSLARFCRGAGEMDALLEESEALSERPLILHRFEGKQNLWGVLVDRWKLIEAEKGYYPNRERSGSIELRETEEGEEREVLLYDRRADPGELLDVVAEHPGVAQTLLEILDAHRSRGARPRSTRTDVEIDGDLLDRLRELGYVK